MPSIPMEHSTEGAPAFETSSTGIPRGDDHTLDGNHGKSGEGGEKRKFRALGADGPPSCSTVEEEGDSFVG